MANENTLTHKYIYANTYTFYEKLCSSIIIQIIFHYLLYVYVYYAIIVIEIIFLDFPFPVGGAFSDCTLFFP